MNIATLTLKMGRGETIVEIQKNRVFRQEGGM